MFSGLLGCGGSYAKKSRFPHPHGGLCGLRWGDGVPLIPTQRRCPQAWLTEIHEYAQKDVVIMLLGNKVRAGSPFTPLFAVSLLSSWLGGTGLGGCSACQLGALCLHPLLHPPLASAAFWA